MWIGVGRSGGAPGMGGEFWLAPSTGAVIIVLSNYDSPPATALARIIAVALEPQRDLTPEHAAERLRQVKF